MSNAHYKQSVRMVAEKVIGNIADNLEEACLMTERYAKQECPVDQDILRASIGYEIEDNNGELIGYIGALEEYGVYVHQGTGIYAVDGNGRKTPWHYEVEDSGSKYKGDHWTKGQRPNPFFTRAINRVKEKIPSILGGD